MTAGDLPQRQLIELALEAISDRAPERLQPLLAPDVVIATERGSHAGHEAALEWASKTYEHVDRRFVLDHLEPVGQGLLGEGRVEYVWRESGELGDSTPVFFALQLTDGLLQRLELYDDGRSARSALHG